jgi:5-hydroxyisourate hydrolase
VTGYAPLSTHVLDTVRGEPARAVPVELSRWDDGAWSPVAAGRTDADGRLRDWVPASDWRVARYRLVFAVGRHLGDAAFFPEIAVTFQVSEPARPHHVPLLLSPYGYTTYRGS